MDDRDITAERARELLHYEPSTGVFTRLVSASTNAKAGDIAGSKNSDGYLQIRVNNRAYKAHRLAFLYMTGVWPEGQIDHLDGNRTNNRIANLRDVSHSVNLQNRKQARSGNSTGLLGVSRRVKGFQATIMVDGKNRNIGTFKTPELAHTAYLAAKRQHHEGCTI